MYEDTLELAENKLLLLYIIDNIKMPISNTQLTDIVLENNFLNYFTLQQYIFELTSSNFIKSIEKEGKIRIGITERGSKILSMFFNRISPSKIKVIDDYLEKHIQNIKRQLTITADYTIDDNNSFIVNLGAAENESILIDLKLTVGSNKEARKLCSKWKENCSDLYTKLIEILIDEEEAK